VERGSHGVPVLGLFHRQFIEVPVFRLKMQCP
jgi:hypothetical protein